MLAQDVTYVLAQEALDALAELLDPIHVRLRHSPRAIRSVRLARLERLDLLLDLEIPRYVCDQVADRGERLHRLNRHRLLERQVVQPGHAHQAWLTVDFG